MTLRSGHRLATWAVAIVLSGCAQPEAPAPPSVTRLLPDQESRNVTQVVSRGGTKQAEIHAPRVLKFDRDRRSLLEGGVTVRFFSADGHVVSTLTAARGQIDEQTRRLTAIDRVVLVNHYSTVLTTDTLRWDEQGEKVTGPGRVRIVRDEGTEVGTGFEAETDLSSWTLLQVETQLTPEAKP